MLNNYYTLFHLSKEFGSSLSGARILQASTRSDRTLDILLETQHGNAAGLVISCQPQMNFIYMEGSAGGKLKGANVLPEVLGNVVIAIKAISNERQLRFEFDDGNFLQVNLFGAAANIYHADLDRVIINSFLKPSTKVGKKLPFEVNSIGFPGDVIDLRSRFMSVTGNALQQLSQCIPTVDSMLAREILYRYDLSVGGTIDDSGRRDLRRPNAQIDFEILDRILSGIHRELLTPSPRIYFSGQIGSAFGLIELRHLQAQKFEEYNSVNECIRNFVIRAGKSKKIADIKTEVLGKLSRKISSLKRTLAKIESDLADDRAARYQAFGEYVMCHVADIKKGDTSVFIEENEEEIKLDPSLKPVRNAQNYFDKAKRARESLRQAKERKKVIAEELREAETLLDEVVHQDDVDSLSSLREEKAVGYEKHSPFREFERSGYRIYVGKDAKNNDELTFGFAKPNDVFLHARGVSGSHVIIRNPSREFPQKPILQFAASIAAHYSKARTSGIVPVAYTMRKFVKKAKGQPGAVLLDREEVIFVKPGIPL
ncbi:MAG TPA: NFACT RNA binding domain-containing protein [Candidatus Acidoferrales bacterium]|nr:NFACT RNA binding domain-containing protein [Candidatus Acidoferrales bacterium]